MSSFEDFGKLIDSWKEQVNKILRAHARIEGGSNDCEEAIKEMKAIYKQLKEINPALDSLVEEMERYCREAVQDAPKGLGKDFSDRRLPNGLKLFNSFKLIKTVMQQPRQESAEVYEQLIEAWKKAVSKSTKAYTDGDVFAYIEGENEAEEIYKQLKEINPAFDVLVEDMREYCKKYIDIVRQGKYPRDEMWDDNSRIFGNIRIVKSILQQPKQENSEEWIPIEGQDRAATTEAASLQGMQPGKPGQTTSKKAD